MQWIVRVYDDKKILYLYTYIYMYCTCINILIIIVVSKMCRVRCVCWIIGENVKKKKNVRGHYNTNIIGHLHSAYYYIMSYCKKLLFIIIDNRFSSKNNRRHRLTHNYYIYIECIIARGEAARVVNATIILYIIIIM